MPPTDEHLRHWANLKKDNRICPAWNEIIDALIDSDDPAEIRRFAQRFKYFSGSLNTYGYWLEEEQKRGRTDGK